MKAEEAKHLKHLEEEAKHLKRFEEAELYEAILKEAIQGNSGKLLSPVRRRATFERHSHTFNTTRSTAVGRVRTSVQGIGSSSIKPTLFRVWRRQ
jgi:hypothetical protein